MTREEILEEQFGELQHKYEESDAQLKRTSKLLEKSREECKKLEEKNQQQDNEIASLQIRLTKMAERVSELDEKEEKIETLTESLDKARSATREKEFEVSQGRRKCEQLEKEIELLREKIDDLQIKNEDLKYQVRVEIDRNARMNQDLDEMDQMRETTARTLKEMEAVNAELSDKTKLLSSARRCIREYRDKTRDFETHREELKKLKEDLQVTQYENHTLKRMMVGKDSLVVQKTQALDLARQLIEHLKCKDEKVAGEVEKLLEQAHFVPTFPIGCSRSEKLADQSPYIDGASNGSQSDLSDNRSGGSIVSRSSSMRSTLRPSSVSTRDLLDIRSVPFSRSGSDLYLPQNGPGSLSSISSTPRPPTNGHLIVSHKPVWGTQTAVVRPQQRSGDTGSDGEGGGSKKGQKKENAIPKVEMERIASLFIHLGDRVQVYLKQDDALHTATVKYIGQLDRAPHERRVYVGIKLDSNYGNCDGTHNGVRYFNVPHNRGRILRVSAIHSILNIKTDQFRTLDDCLREYSKHRRQ